MRTCLYPPLAAGRQARRGCGKLAWQPPHGYAPNHPHQPLGCWPVTWLRQTVEVPIQKCCPLRARSLGPAPCVETLMSAVIKRQRWLPGSWLLGRHAKQELTSLCQHGDAVSGVLDDYGPSA